MRYGQSWGVAVMVVLLVGLIGAGVVHGQGAVLFSATDSAGDDNGPGTYVNPTNSVFYPNAFDVAGFEVVDEGENVVFKIRMAAPVANPWGGPNGMSVQMFQIYVDTDHQKDSGFVEAIPGANVSFASDEAWEKAILAEGGWGNEVEEMLKASAFDEMLAAIQVSHSAKVEGDVVSIPVPKSWLGNPSKSWGYQVVVLGQEGSKEAMDGVKVRRILKNSTEWQFGGSDESGVHPNALDILVPKGKDQHAILKAYDAAAGTYATIPMLYQ